MGCCCSTRKDGKGGKGGGRDGGKGNQDKEGDANNKNNLVKPLLDDPPPSDTCAEVMDIVYNGHDSLWADDGPGAGHIAGSGSSVTIINPKTVSGSVERLDVEDGRFISMSGENADISLDGSYDIYDDEMTLSNSVITGARIGSYLSDEMNDCGDSAKTEYTGSVCSDLYMTPPSYRTTPDK